PCMSRVAQRARSLPLGGRESRLEVGGMAERLREVAQHLAALRVVLLREEPEAVGGRDRSIEHLSRLVEAALAREALGEPEGARHERALLHPEAVVGAVAPQ